MVLRDLNVSEAWISYSFVLFTSVINLSPLRFRVSRNGLQVAMTAAALNFLPTHPSYFNANEKWD